MKNLLSVLFASAFIFFVSDCFSQTNTESKPDVKKTEKTEKKSKEKVKKSESPVDKEEKNAGTTEKIAVTDHGKPADKKGNKKNEDKAVVPKKE